MSIYTKTCLPLCAATIGHEMPEMGYARLSTSWRELSALFGAELQISGSMSMSWQVDAKYSYGDSDDPESDNALGAGGRAFSCDGPFTIAGSRCRSLACGAVTNVGGTSSVSEVLPLPSSPITLTYVTPTQTTTSMSTGTGLGLFGLNAKAFSIAKDSKGRPVMALFLTGAFSFAVGASTEQTYGASPTIVVFTKANGWPASFFPSSPNESHTYVDCGHFLGAPMRASLSVYTQKATYGYGGSQMGIGGGTFTVESVSLDVEA